MENNNIIGITTDCLKLKSDYMPYILFNNIEQQKIAEEYIIKEVSHFFKTFVKEQIDDIARARIPTPYLITDYDFLNVDIKYFYEILFCDLGKRNKQNKLITQIKWGAIFDERCTPIEIAYLSKNYQGDDPKLKKFNDNRRYRKYGTIDINGTPIFYYIYFTVQEILNAIR